MWKHTKDPAYIQTKPAPDPQKVTEENNINEQPLSLIKLWFAYHVFFFLYYLVFDLLTLFLFKNQFCFRL